MHDLAAVRALGPYAVLIYILLWCACYDVQECDKHLFFFASWSVANIKRFGAFTWQQCLFSLSCVPQAVFPPKKMFGNTDPAFLAKRKDKLSVWLQQVVKMMCTPQYLIHGTTHTSTRKNCHALFGLPKLWCNCLNFCVTVQLLKVRNIADFHKPHISSKSLRDFFEFDDHCEGGGSGSAEAALELKYVWRGLTS